MIRRDYKLLNFFYEIRWVIVTVVLICAAWFGNEHQIKLNGYQIKQLQIDINEINYKVKVLDDNIDKDTNKINVLQEKIKWI